MTQENRLINYQGPSHRGTLDDALLFGIEPHRRESRRSVRNTCQGQKKSYRRRWRSTKIDYLRTFSSSFAYNILRLMQSFIKKGGDHE